MPSSVPVPPKLCPICQKPSSPAMAPFCSGRCADVDLNRWLTGAYIIPARDDEHTIAENDPEQDD